MNPTTPETVRQTWEWKQRIERATAGMSRCDLIRFYRNAADELEKELGMSLPRAPRKTRHTVAKGRDAR